ncbi:DUF814 domain-containing protein [Marivirga sp. S37H4]|uniref:DUF814 domain-containing protein n=1 Tax=Marivirga aurantiaca TaxID=2802615 RepID=A0A934WW61_9BACT|nr:NFACT RNA binding domain-containing protein [Marivirga aurantiaca]MBK6264179.1 DUF814 domain-containing protein [Marivirga aurantiaca]
MHNNYYAFRILVRELRSELIGKKLNACFSQSKDELILVFRNNIADKGFHIKASLTPEFSCLCFPRDFARTKKNSVDLFHEFIEQPLKEIIQYENERSFSLHFENGLSLLFKMHGNRSNIIAFEGNQPYKLFRSNFPQDLSLKPEELHRSLQQDKNHFFDVEGNYKKLFPTFGKLISKYFDSLHLSQKPLDEQWEIISLLLHDLLNPTTYYTILWDDEIYFSLLPIGEVLKEEDSIIEGITQFYYIYSKENFIRKEKKQLLKVLEKKRNQNINYINKSKNKLQEIKDKPGYNELADIIMANMHQIPHRAKEVELLNFYTNEMVTIPLKSNLSPQKNAENLYRKSKNQKIELQQIQEAITAKESILERIEREIDAVNAAEDIKSIKSLIRNNPKAEHAQVEERVPYKKFETAGFTILVGKGARENDELTLKYAKKDDLWLHAKDVSGSHVILKHQSNKPFPQEVIEKAAQLAAFYSKRKTDSLTPVIVTPKKFVRKPKGLPPGLVHVDKENTILVSPNDWWSKIP